MNKHYHDSAYYLKRAGEHAVRGLRETVQPVFDRVRSLAGREPEPEVGRVDAVLENVREIEYRARDEAHEVAADARTKLDQYRTTE